MRVLNVLRRAVSQHWIWPGIDSELTEFKAKGILRGRVLNAGAGTRDISHLIEGELCNQDISWVGDTRTHIHIFSPIHKIPKSDGYFDTIICIAVLEHVENPEDVLPEFFRVIKAGGH